MIKRNGGKGLHAYSFDLGQTITVLVLLGGMLASYFMTTGGIREEIAVHSYKIEANHQKNEKQDVRIEKLFDTKVDKP